MKWCEIMWDCIHTQWTPELYHVTADISNLRYILFRDRLYGRQHEATQKQPNSWISTGPVRIVVFVRVPVMLTSNLPWTRRVQRVDVVSVVWPAWGNTQRSTQRLKFNLRHIHFCAYNIRPETFCRVIFTSEVWREVLSSEAAGRGGTGGWRSSVPAK